VNEERHRRIAEWVTRAVLPHEPAVRTWLARSLVNPADIDDLIQEAYCKLARVEAFEAIERPDGYFFRVVRNLLLNQLRHARLVRIEALNSVGSGVEQLAYADDAPSPEQAAGAQRELARVKARIDALPERCRAIFRLRKLEGLSQREIAARLGVSENVVEHETARGLKLVMAALADDASRTVRPVEERRA
jgi:RNA polymerase sigma factor (sigma-70 family)